MSSGKVAILHGYLPLLVVLGEAVGVLLLALWFMVFLGTVIDWALGFKADEGPSPWEGREERAKAFVLVTCLIAFLVVGYLIGLP